jgi:hypothetical protein
VGSNGLDLCRSIADPIRKADGGPRMVGRNGQIRSHEEQRVGQARVDSRLKGSIVARLRKCPLVQLNRESAVAFEMVTVTEPEQDLCPSLAGSGVREGAFEEPATRGVLAFLERVNRSLNCPPVARLLQVRRRQPPGLI